MRQVTIIALHFQFENENNRLLINNQWRMKMKTILKNKSLILLAALVTSNAFAVDVAFDTEDLNNNALFTCAIVKDNTGAFQKNTINMQAFDPIVFENNKPSINNLSKTDLDTYCFKVTKGSTSGKGHVAVIEEHNSELACTLGSGGRPIYQIK